jgi:hypothetical protein
VDGDLHTILDSLGGTLPNHSSSLRVADQGKEDHEVRWLRVLVSVVEERLVKVVMVQTM